jgi:hypothetical protein
MKNLYPKSSSAVLKLCIALLITSVAIIYGCKKERAADKDATPASADVSDAKTWFEKTYPIGSSSGQSNHTNSTGTGFDLSQRIKPDWQHTATYARLGKDVIEMPIDPDSKFGSILKKKVNNHTYSKTYTRSSYLLLKGEKGYQAYIMTIIGDSSYIKGNPDKLANNTYRQHDADFGGLVLYFTPKGKYLNGYAYKNGQLITPASQAQSAPGKIKVQLAEICTDWYDEILINDVIVSSTYLYTTCTGGGEDPTYPGTSGSDSPVPPNPCNPPPPPPTTTPPPSVPNPPTGPLIPSAVPGGHITVNNVPGGGGFPPPTDEEIPCADEQEIIIDSLKKNFPCAVKLILDKLMQNPTYNNFALPFTSTKKPDLKWENGTLPWNSAAPNSSGNTYVLGRTDYTDRSATITLNTSMLNNSSQLLITAAAIHETLHAYINYNIVTAVSGLLPPPNYDSNGSWIYSLNTWAMVNGLPANYVDHYQMLNDYFSKSVGILSSLDNNQHTPKEYAMAMLYGMDNVVSGDAAQQALLQTEYNSLLTKYGITSSDKDSFNRANLNSASNKLPKTGCN